jgi:NADP-dependent 3-hydroxy acid dehydrogenase YdfG
MYLEKLVNQSTDIIDSMIDINIKGVLNGIAGVLKGMISRKSGTIINISSIAGHKAFGNHVAYCGTKAAVVMISEALREEVSGQGVRVSVVCPGVVETELLSHNTTKIIDGYEQWKKSCGKMLDAKDVSDSIVFVYNMPQHVCIRDLVIGPTAQTQ